jgi:PDZ domain
MGINRVQAKSAERCRRFEQREFHDKIVCAMSRQGWTLIVVWLLATGVALNAGAQNATPDSQFQAPSGSSTQRQSGTANSDAALEISPPTAPARAEAVSPSAPADSGELTTPEPELPPVPTSGPPSSMLSASGASHQPLPYLGLSVQSIESHSTPGRNIEGLEIVSVDPDGPAARAGLRGRAGMTTLGASGATAGALMAPLDIALMPLLKKAGQLGQTGDLIVAIDDRRVIGEVDLQTALSESKPGDIIYLTILRLTPHGAGQTIKIPVKLGTPANQ